LWFEKFPFRLECNDDIQLFEKENGGSYKSKLSPLTNLTLNLLCGSSIDSNFIICIPSAILRPIPLISYIWAKQTGHSVMVFSKNKIHHDNYYSLKIEYSSKFVNMDFPAAKVKSKGLCVEPYTPRAKSDYKKQYKEYIKGQINNKDCPKIFFYQGRSLKFSTENQKIHLFDELIEDTCTTSNLDIRNVIFENIDNIIYNKYRYDNFIKWLEEASSLSENRYLFHISNPNYKFLTQLKEQFNAKVLYFPFSFLKANELLKEKNREYYGKMGDFNHSEAISMINIDQSHHYDEADAGKLELQKILRNGNIDDYFLKGMRLFEKISYENIPKELSHLIFNLKHLFFVTYKIFTIPSDFSIKLYEEEYGWRYYHFTSYLARVLRIFQGHILPPNLETLTDIILFLSKMVNELTECKRYGENISYSREGKYYSLFNYLNEHPDENIVIGVQTGEKSLILEKLENLEIKGQLRIQTFKTLARIIKDYSDHTLLLPGSLLPNRIQILFKNWKNVLFFVYDGFNKKWTLDQIDLIEKIDLTKEELSILYLAEVYKDLNGVSNFNLEKEPLFSSFLEKKKAILNANRQDVEIKTSPKNDVTQILNSEAELKSVTIKDLFRKLMKENEKFKDLIAEEKIKKLVDKRNKQSEKKYYQEKIGIECLVVLENEITGEELTIPLDHQKKYMNFRDKEDIRIKQSYPFGLNKGHFLILFDKEKRLSISDFIKEAYEFEEDIDHDLIREWQGRLSSFYLKNYKNYKSFFRDFDKNFPNSISYNEFREWVKGSVNYTQDPRHLLYLGQLMNDSFFIENYKLIYEEGRKIHKINMILGRKIKKLVNQVLEKNISWKEYSEEERLLMEKIENCIYKIKDINITR